MSGFGIELLSVFGMPPVEYVELAAALGCGHISTGLTNMSWNPENYPSWSLPENQDLRHRMKAAMREHQVVVGLGEGFLVRPGQQMRDRLADLDLMAELGELRVSGITMDPDLERSKDEFALLAQYALNRPHFHLLIDAMHFYRSGGETAELRALDPELIGYAQLCDVPLKPTEAEAGIKPYDRLKPAVEAAQAMLADRTARTYDQAR